MFAHTINTQLHPIYKENADDWKLWRDVYEGGRDFIREYLEKFDREGDADFKQRLAMTYNPAFAKEAVNEIKNSIFQRLVDISRVGGSTTYTESMKGNIGGVDMKGSSMSSFIGREILPELLVMSKVGIYVDMPSIVGKTLLQTKEIHPYIYIYPIEDLRSWDYDEGDNLNEFKSILLRDVVFENDKDTGLPTGRCERYKRLWLEDGKVHVQYYNASGKEIFATGEDAAGYVKESIVVLDIDKIPFTVASIGDSLLCEVAQYQVALLNLVSSDISYALYSNYPFYTEQYEPRMDGGFTQIGDGKANPEDGTAQTREVRTGSRRGRRYARNLERPGFIHPSSEPLKASMEKQEQMKQEIRQLVNLAVTNLIPKMASAESKQADNAGLESGLSYIGLELEQAERRIALYWSMYEKSKQATVNYPERYDIKTREEKQKEAETLADLLPRIPSETYQKAVMRRIAELTVGRDVSSEDLAKIFNEIEAAKGLTSRYDEIMKDVETGLVDLNTASRLRGYPAGTVLKAAKDHADRLARIKEAQTPDGGEVRGIADTHDAPGRNASAEKKESTDTSRDDTVSNKQRGADQGSRKAPVRK